MHVLTPTEMLIEAKALSGLGEIGLSKRLGVSQATVNRILNGQSGCSLPTLRAIENLHSEIIAEHAHKASLDVDSTQRAVA